MVNIYHWMAYLALFVCKVSELIRKCSALYSKYSKYYKWMYNYTNAQWIKPIKFVIFFTQTNIFEQNEAQNAYSCGWTFGCVYTFTCSKRFE